MMVLSKLQRQNKFRLLDQETFWLYIKQSLQLSINSNQEDSEAPTFSGFVPTSLCKGMHGGSPSKSNGHHNFRTKSNSQN
jgi:hypothetical protein